MAPRCGWRVLSVREGRTRAALGAEFRETILDAAYDAHPERFVRGRPKPLQLAPASYINRPSALPEDLPPAEEVKTAA
jgi:hypothetical protein